jgi:hypothetical protein
VEKIDENKNQLQPAVRLTQLVRPPLKIAQKIQKNRQIDAPRVLAKHAKLPQKMVVNEGVAQPHHECFSEV